MFFENNSYLRLVLFILPLIFIAIVQSENSWDAPASSDEKLKLIFLFHRHGERSPYGFYPNDPHQKDIMDKIGLGQLINKGKRRLFSLGKFLKKRYHKLGLLPLNSSRQIYSRSSASVRCLQSNSLLLAGMFPPENQQEWNDDLGKLWQPLPIQTSPFVFDSYLNPDYECPSAENELLKIYSSYEVQKLNNENNKLLDHLANVTGLKNKAEANIAYGAFLYDVFLSEKNCGYEWPNWYTEDVRQKLSILNDEVFQLNSTSRKTQRLRCGSIFNEMFTHLNNHFNSTGNNNGDDYRVYIYSTHDEWLAVFLSAMKVYNFIPPSFGSTIMLEVYENSSEHYIRGRYLNATETEQIFPLEFPGCDHRLGCTLEQFHKLVEDLIADPDDLRMECIFNLKKRL